MWSFSGLSLPLEEKENLGLNMAAVTVAAQHRSQCAWFQSSPVLMMALFMSEVAFTLSSHSEGQPSYPCFLPSTAAVLLSASYPQIHSHVHTHKCIDICTYGLSFLFSPSSNVSLTEVLRLSHSKVTCFGLPVTCISEQSS